MPQAFRFKELEGKGGARANQEWRIEVRKSIKGWSFGGYYIPLGEIHSRLVGFKWDKPYLSIGLWIYTLWIRRDI